MSSAIGFLQANPLIVLFLVMGLGVLLGQAQFRMLSLGDSGVLFAALGAGALGLSIPTGITDLGIVLFLYVVGLSAGPRFFRSFRRHAASGLILTATALGSALLTTIALDRIFRFGPELATGIFVGAMTTTPGLAAALEALGEAPGVSVGYGIAYPFGIVGIVLFTQMLPRLLRVDLARLAEEIEARERPPRVVAAWFLVENPDVAGQSVAELTELRAIGAAISRIARGGEVLPVRSELVLQLGDRAKVVAREDRMEMLGRILGLRVADFVEPVANLTTRDLFITRDEIVGKSLAELGLRQRHGVSVSRLWRDDIEMVPGGSASLEIGDRIRIVGPPEGCREVAAIAGDDARTLQETRFLSLALGLLAGVLLGAIPLPLPGGSTMRLGTSGGPLLAGVLAGHFGRIGSLTFRLPLAAKLFVRKLGLYFFLAGAGIAAGGPLLAVLSDRGPELIAGAIILAIVPLAATFLVARYWLRLDLLTALGTLCGAMTSTPGLGAVTTAARSEIPALAYTAVYPSALILIILAAQALARFLSG